MAYIYNPDVHSFGNPKQYIGCDIVELQVQKRIHPDLKDENFPSPEVLRHSKHIHHVLDNLKRIDEAQKQSNEHKH